MENVPAEAQPFQRARPVNEGARSVAEREWVRRQGIAHRKFSTTQSQLRTSSIMTSFPASDLRSSVMLCLPRLNASK